MKTHVPSILRRTTRLAAAAALALAVPSPATAAWDLPFPSPAGEREEFAKAAVATDLAGNVFSAGYHDFGAGDIRAFVTYRNGATGAVIANDLWRPAAAQFHYTAIAFDGAANCLYLTGTRTAGGVSSWFVRRLNVNPGVGFLPGGWVSFYNPATFGLAGANAYGSDIAFDGTGVYVAGCFNNGIAAVRLLPGSGAFDAAAWGTGYRIVSGAGWVCPPVVMPGSATGGIYAAVRMSFIRVTPSSVFLGGTIDRLSGSLADYNVLRINKGTGATPWGAAGVVRDNGRNNDYMLGLAAIGDYSYATGDSVNGANNYAFTTALMADGTNRGATPLVGLLGSYANDIEARDNAGTFEIFIGGNDSRNGAITRHQSTATGAVGAAAVTPYGARVTDEVCDLIIGTAGRTGFVYATGQTWNLATLSNGQQIMRIDPAGPVTAVMLPSGYTECAGSAVIYTPNGGGHVFTHGNALAAGAFSSQHTEVAP